VLPVPEKAVPPAPATASGTPPRRPSGYRPAAAGGKENLLLCHDSHDKCHAIVGLRARVGLTGVMPNTAGLTLDATATREALMTKTLFPLPLRLLFGDAHLETPKGLRRLLIVRGGIMAPTGAMPRVCAWCQRVATGPSGWHEVEEAVRLSPGFDVT